MNPVNICYISGHIFGYQALRGLLGSDEYKRGALRITLLISIDGSKRDSTVGFFDFHEIAEEYSLPHATTLSIKERDCERMINEAVPDFLLIIGYSELAPPNILNIPRRNSDRTHRHG